MNSQTAIQVTAGSNYVQLRCKREPDPFFFKINEGRSSAGALVGDVVDRYGECVKPNEEIKRSRIARVTRAILAETMGGSRSLIPVNPILPVGKPR